VWAAGVLAKGRMRPAGRMFDMPDVIGEHSKIIIKKTFITCSHFSPIVVKYIMKLRPTRSTHNTNMRNAYKMWIGTGFVGNEDNIKFIWAIAA